MKVIILLLTTISFAGVFGFSGGDGSASDPYIIETQSHLEAVNNDLSAHYALEADIDLASTEYDAAVIAPEQHFTGSFDGQGNKITGLTIINSKNTSNLGLIGITNQAMISNVGIEDAYIEATHNNASRIGALVGYTINTDVVNCYSTGEITGKDRVGGLVGFNYDSSIADSYSGCAVTAGGEYAGGLVGYNHLAGAFTNCYATGDVTGSSKVGGLAGENYEGETTGCFATGTISGSFQTGGLFGLNQHADISDSYSTGDVYGNDETGGFCGRNQNGIINECYAEGNVSGQEYSGGLVGYNNSGQISNCYALGAVGGTDSYTGGFVGRNDSGNINCCYAEGGVNGADDTGGFTGYTGTGSTITVSYSKGDVSGNSNVGGFTGYNNGSTIRNSFTTSSINADNNAGGFAGYNVSGGSFQYCYAAGAINSSGSMVGGFLGASWSGAHIANFWDTETAGISTSQGTEVYGVTSSQMKDESTFTAKGWNFEDVWMTLPGEEPVLQCSNTSTPMLGDGTLDDPYQIQTAAHLEQVNDDINAYYILTSDIDLSSRSYETAVISPDLDNSSSSYSGESFKGGFDGNGYSISGLTIDTQGKSNHYLGLFGFVSSKTIRNLIIEDITIISGENSRYIGAAAGWNSSATLESCYADGQITLADGASSVGGLVGRTRHGTTLNSSCEVNITGGDGVKYVGGVLGYSDQWGKIINTYSAGDVTTGDNSENVGGLIGKNWFGAVSDSFAAGDVAGGENSQYIGGLSGYNSGSLTGSYAIGQIQSEGDYVGGLSGYNYFGHIENCYATADIIDAVNYVGGLVGTNFKGVIYDCYAAGSVNGDNYLGGMVGTEVEAMTGGSFWDIEASGLNESAAGTPKLTSQMQETTPYTDAGWDFSSNWQMPENGYPTLIYPNIPIPDAPNKFSGGAGTKGNPYKISNTDDWQELMTDTQTWDKYFILTADLDLEAITVSPVGNQAAPFKGEFDGNGFEITNAVIIEQGDDVGLFGVTKEALLENIKLTKADISGNANVAALAGNCSETVIVDCQVADGNVSGSSTVGALAGLAKSYSMIESSQAQSVVYCQGSIVGGLIGENNLSTISKSFAVGTVAGDNDYAGGLVGYNELGVIENSYSAASVIGQNYIGGFVGASYQSHIADSYSAGNVSGESTAEYVGGFIGSDEDSNVTDCYWDSQTAGTAQSGPGTPLQTAQMKSSLTFTSAGWDFQEIWWVPTDDYPKIKTPMKGSGSYINPYQVENRAHLEDINKTLGDDHNKYNYILMADIDASGTTYSSAVIAPDSNSLTTEFEGDKFKGVFNGNGYKITGVNIDSDGQTAHYLGLFGCVDGATVKNLAVEVDISTGENSRFIGGIAGWNNSYRLSNSYSKGQITVGDYCESIGGLVGENRGTISASMADVEIDSGEGAKFVGGLVGWNGVVGGGQKPGNISNSYAKGTINGTPGNYSDQWAYGGSGGLVGANWFGDISNCYSTTLLADAKNIGGLLGYSNGGDIANSFWDAQATQIAESAAGSPLTTDQMLDTTIFIDAEWDFDSLWTQTAGEYPALAFEDTIFPQDATPANADEVEMLMFVTNNWLSPAGTDIDINQKTDDDIVDMKIFSNMKN